MTRIAALAALYAVLTVMPPLNALGYGPVQIRVSEALTVLPFFVPWTPWGLYLGCIAANLAGPFLAWDVTLGAVATLVAAIITSRLPKTRMYLAPLPPVLLNSVVVSFYVSRLTGLPYLPTAFYIGAGEAAACYGLGYPLLLWLSRNQKALEVLRGKRT